MRSLVDRTTLGGMETGPADLQLDGYPATVHREGWLQAETLLAAVVTFIIAMRIVVVPQLLLTAGDLAVFALVPLWFPITRRYVGARLVLLLGVLAIVGGAVLTLISSVDHETDFSAIRISAVLVLGMLCSFGFLLWAREKLGNGVLGVVFGLGLLVGVSQTGALYTANPWRFGFSVAVTVLVLGLVHASKGRLLPLLAVLVLTLVSALTDARSSFALLLLTATLLAWQMRPLAAGRRGSVLRGILGLGIFAAVIYNVGQALILNGYLGVKTQQRSLQQVNETGSLILGGRPELTATLALMRDHFIGFGTGTFPNHHDLTVAKTGMAAIGYDPNNGYVENWMFGHGFALHSVIGDLWAQSGLIGLALSLTILVLTLRGISRRLVDNAASALLLYASFKTIWNLFFGPWYSSIALLTLSLALTMLPRTPTEATPAAVGEAEPLTLRQPTTL